MQIVDIANPAKPVMKGYIPSHTDTFSGEGWQVITMRRPPSGDLLVYQNEWCPGTTNGVGGISLVDVRNPSSPKKLVEGAGDFTKKDGTQSKGVPQTRANQTHSAFAWTNKETGKVYVVLVDDMEELDVDILDITNPSKPKIVSETNLDQFAQTRRDPAAPRLRVQPRHDRQAHRQPRHHADVLLGRRLRHARRDQPRRARGAVGHRLRRRRPGARGVRPDDHAEGNGHQAEFTRDNQYFFATDEDFNPYRVQATFKGGPAAATTFTAIQGSATKPVNKDNPLVGRHEFVGLGCDPLSTGGAGKIAVAERGTCDFQVKLDNAVAAGYKGRSCSTAGAPTAARRWSRCSPSRRPRRRSSCRARTGSACSASSRTRYTCGTASETDGTNTPAGPSVPVDISAVFDGWGYTHMYGTDLTPGAKMSEVDYYAPIEGQREAEAEGFGDMTVHEVATDPDKDLVYISHYALGMRVLSYDASGAKEVGAFVEAGGSNYWGVEVHKMNGKTYILGSDRDRGLRIFTFGG